MMEVIYYTATARERAGINEIQKIGVVIDKYFKIERAPRDHCILRDEGGANTKRIFQDHHNFEQATNNF